MASLGVLSQPPHEEVGLHGLRSEDVVTLSLSESPRIAALSEPHHLGSQSSVGSVVKGEYFFKKFPLFLQIFPPKSLPFTRFKSKTFLQT